MSIQAIDHSSIHRLTSGQVVIDLQTAVKELLENALDAGASSVVLQFKEHGVEAIEVQDNGRGIGQSDWAGIALKHHTSKLTTFADLISVSTLGFRGEALSSLCGTASLSIVTATADTAPAGTLLSFAPSGECIVGGKAARSKGTTVVVRELFKTLPVRRKELIKNAKREFAKAVELVTAYALVKTGCRFEVKNIVKGKSSTHLQTPLAATVRANFSSIFTPKSLTSMMDLDLVLDVAADKSVLKWTDDGIAASSQVVVKGLISKPTTGNGRTASNRQFFYVNGRPFAPTKVAKAVNEVYKSFNTGSFPAVVADFQLPPDAYDVNVSPDKRTIFLHSEGNLIAALKSALEEVFQPSRSTFAMSQIGPFAKAPTGLKRSASSTNAGSSKDALSSSPPPSSSAKTASTTAAEDDEEEEHEERPAKRMKKSLIATPGVVATVAVKVEEEIEEHSRIGRSQNGSMENEGDLQDYAELEIVEDRTEERELDEPSFSPRDKPRRLPQSTLIVVEPTVASPSPSRSPSPSSDAPPKQLRQMTLDTSGASWARKTEFRPPAGRGVAVEKKRGASVFKASLKQYLHPSQQAPDGDEGEVVAVELEEVEEDAMIEDDWEGQGENQADADSDDEVLVVEDSFSPPSPTANSFDDDDLEIVEDSCGCSHGKKEAIDRTLDEEREDHLTLLDQAGETANTDAPGSLRAEVWGSQLAVDTTVLFNMASIAADWTGRFHPVASGSRGGGAVDSDALAGAGLQQDLDEAEETLSRIVSKDDFASMKVIGQFNHAFIIARRRVASTSDEGKGKGKARLDDDNDDDGAIQDDLFIIDQHASDEKYNFERLQIDTVIQSQRLLQPRALNLPSHDEITAMEHLDILRLNGFDVLVNEDADVGERVKLIAQPVSKDTVFGAEDLEELLELIKSSSSSEVVRPSKARKMFASRACRKSVMFGKPLNTNQMTTIVRHMGGMDQPWSCPHGRPTLRWV